MNEREKERKKEIQKEDDYSGFSQTHTCFNMQLEFAVFVLTVVPHLLEFLIKFSAMIYLFTIVKVIQKTYKWPFHATSFRWDGRWLEAWLVLIFIVVLFPLQ